MSERLGIQREERANKCGRGNPPQGNINGVLRTCTQRDIDLLGFFAKPSRPQL